MIENGHPVSSTCVFATAGLGSICGPDEQSSQHGAFDMEMFARVVIEELRTGYRLNRSVIPLPLDSARIPIVVPIKGGAWHIIRLRVDRIEKILLSQML